jgi:hypothetical protein
VWYFYINNGSDEPKTLNQPPITESSEPPKETAAGSPTESTDAQPTPPPPTQAPTTVVFNSKVGKSTDQYDIGPAGVPHQLEIKVNGGRNWIEVREGGATGNKLFYANAEDGALQTYELSDALYINVGRADLAEIKVDGVLVPDGDRANSKKLLLKLLATGDGSASGDGESTGNEADDDGAGSATIGD